MSHAWGRSTGIVLLGWIVTLLVATTWQDVTFWDESMYLHWRHFINWRLALDFPSGAPLYLYWYKVLGRVVRDPLTLYFASWAVLLTVIWWIPHWLRLPRAWAYSLLLGATPIFHIWPYVSLLSAAIVLLALCLVIRLQMTLRQTLLMAGATCLLCSAVRPEFASGTLPPLLLALAAGRPVTRGQTASLAALAGIAGTSLCLLHHGGDARATLAFMQHYNIRAHEQGLLTGSDPMISNHVLRAFGMASDNIFEGNVHLGDFWRAKPMLMLAHIGANIADPALFLPALLILAVTGLPFVMPSKASLRPAALFALLMFMPVLAGMALVYPREHYLVSIAPAVMLMLISLLPRPARLQRMSPWLLAIPCVAFVIWPVIQRMQSTGSIHGPHPGISEINCLRALEKDIPKQPALLLGDGGIEYAYLRRDWQQAELSQTSIQAHWPQTLDALRPDIVQINAVGIQMLKRPSREVEQDLLARGYRKSACPGAPLVHLYVR